MRSSTTAWRASNYPAACWIFVGEFNQSLEGIQLPSCLLDFCGRVQPEPGGHPTTQLPAGPLWRAQPEPGGHPTTQLPAGFLWASSTIAWRASNYPAACWTFVGELNQSLEGIQLPSCLLDFCGRAQPQPGGHPTTQLPAGFLWSSPTRARRAPNYPAACWTFVGELNQSLEGIQLPSCLPDLCGRVQPEPRGQTSCRSFLSSST